MILRRLMFRFRFIRRAKYYTVPVCIFFRASRRPLGNSYKKTTTITGPRRAGRRSIRITGQMYWTNSTRDSTSRTVQMSSETLRTKETVLLVGWVETRVKYKFWTTVGFVPVIRLISHQHQILHQYSVRHTQTQYSIQIHAHVNTDLSWKPASGR